MNSSPGPAWLFCPADRPERYAKAAAAADVVILDLEDGVAAADKEFARQALLGTRLDPGRTVVRINPAGTADHDLDRKALARTDYTAVMLAKTEAAAAVKALAPLAVIALVETARGALAVAEIASAANAVGLMWGAEDLIASLGGQSSRGPGGGYRSVAAHVRSTTLLAAAAAGRFALDAVYLDIADLAGLEAEATDAAASGFAATVCIHPTQAAVVRRAYRPTPDKLAWAERVLAAAGSERGVFTVDGQMVDAPVLRQAEQIIRRAGSD